MDAKLRAVPVSLWKRVFAYFVDLAVINFIVVLPFQKVMQKMVEVKSEKFMELFRFFEGNPETIKTVFFVSLLVSILTILYWAVLEFKLKQSVGKMLFKIYVRNTKKGNLKFSQCLIRNITKVSLIPIALDSLYMIFTKQHQRYFEKISNTEVIDKNLMGVK